MTTLNENPTQIYTSTAIAFELGQVVMTQGVAQLLGSMPHELLMPCLVRHQNGDWGFAPISAKSPKLALRPLVTRDSEE